MSAGLIADFIASVERGPDRPAILDIASGRTTTRATILRDAVALATRLDDVAPEDAVVMLHGPGGAAYWSGLLAVFGTGRRLLPLGTETSARDRAGLHAAHRVDVIVETDPRASWVDAPDTPHLVVDASSDVLDTTAIDRLGRGGAASLLLRSSGTTGRPSVALRTAAALDRVSGTLVDILELHDEDEVLATLPMQHAYGIEHGVFAPNHKLRKGVTALAIGNIGKRREAAAGRHGNEGHAKEGCSDSPQKPRSHDTSRIAWAKLMARVGEEFPLECPTCGGDIRLIAFITEPGPIRKILTHLGEPLEPPPISPARGPPTDWGELVQVHDDRDVFQASPDELPAVDIHSL